MIDHPAKHVLFWQEKAALAATAAPIVAYQQHLYSAIARYSAGEPLEDVRKALAKAVAFLASDIWKSPIQLQDSEQYYAAIWGLSMSILFGDANPVFEQRLAGQDSLVDHLLLLTGSKIVPTEKLLHPNPFAHLLEALQGPANEAGPAIDVFLKTWYAGMGRTPWHDTHLRQDPAFFGYWSLELAAVVKAKNITDAAFADNIFYPRDMVHQRLYRTWLDSPLGEDDRKARTTEAVVDDLAIAQKALSAFFGGQEMTGGEGDSLARAMKMLSSVLGFGIEDLQKNPQLVRVAILQIFQATLAISKSALEESADTTNTGNGPMLQTIRDLTEKAGLADADMEEASKMLAAAEGFEGAQMDPQERLDNARERLQSIHSTLEGLVQKEKESTEALFDGLDELVRTFASSLGIEPKKADIKAETMEKVAGELEEANRKNMIGSDFDWSSIWKKE